MWLLFLGHISQFLLPGFSPCLKNAPHRYTQLSSLPNQCTALSEKGHNLSPRLWCSLGRGIAGWNYWGAEASFCAICLIQPLFWLLTHSGILFSVTLWFLPLLVTTDDHTTQLWTPKPYLTPGQSCLTLSPTPYHPHHPQGAKMENCRNQVKLSSLTERQGLEFYRKKRRTGSQEKDQETGRTWQPPAPPEANCPGAESTTSLENINFLPIDYYVQILSQGPQTSLLQGCHFPIAILQFSSSIVIAWKQFLT